MTVVTQVLFAFKHSHICMYTRYPQLLFSPPLPQLRRQVNGFLVTELVVVSDRRQVGCDSNSLLSGKLPIGRGLKVHAVV